MALIGNLTVTMTATTTDFDGKMRKTRQELKLTQDQIGDVAKGLGQLGSTMVQTAQITNAIEKGFVKAASALRAMKKEVKETEGSLGAVSGYFKQLGADILRFGSAAIAFQGIKSGAESLLDSAVKSQALTAAFVAITGSSQAAEQQLGFVRATADKLGFSFTALAGAYKGIQAATRGTNLEGQATQEIFTAVATASRVLQLSTDDTRGILLALQQVISKGTVQAEELRGQIGERLPGAFGIAARAMGVTEKELTKLLETGALASNVFIPKFARQLQKEFAGGADEASKTFAAATERLGNAFLRLGEEVARSGVLTELGKILDKLTGIIAAGPKAAEALRKTVAGQTAKDVEPLAREGLDASAVGKRFLDQLNNDIVQKERDIVRLQSQIDSLVQRNPTSQNRGYAEGVYARAIAQAKAELAALQADKANLIEAIRGQAIKKETVTNFGESGEIGGGRGTLEDTTTGGVIKRLKENPPAGTVAAQLKDLNALLKQQIEETNRALAALDRKLVLAPGSLDAIMEERAEVLKKARIALETTLASPAYKDLVPLLQTTPGAAQTATRTLSVTNAAFKGANPEGLAAALPLIEAQAPAYGLDPSLVAALVYQESRFNPRARSPKNAQGLGQLIPGTARDLGVTDPFDIQQNLTGTFKYLQQLTAQFKGNTELILAAYNAGPGAVAKAGNRIPNYPETQKYVPAVLARQRAITGGVGVEGPLSPITAVDDLLQREKGAQAYVDARKEQIKIEKDLQQAQEQTAKAALAEGTAALERLTQMASAVQPLKEARDADVAALLVLKVQTAGLVDIEAKRLEQIILTGARIKDNAVLAKEAAERTEKEGMDIYKSINALRAYQDQLELSGGALKATAEARAVVKAEATLRNLPEGLQDEGQAVIDRLRKAAQEATPLFKALTSASDAFADSFLSTIEQVTSGGIKSFKGFVDSVLQDLQRIINQQVLQPALSGLVKAGLKLGLDYLGLSGNTGGGADFGSAGPSNFGGGGGFASGGPVTAGRSYFVGEKGPEPFIPAVNGRIVSHEEALAVLSRSGKQSASGGQAPISVTVNVHGPKDAASILRSRAEIQRAYLQAFQQAQRAA